DPQLNAAAAWAKAHGGGTVAVDAQSGAATSILAGHANVAGIGGFSGAESTVTVSWIEQMAKQGRITYLMNESQGPGGAGMKAIAKRFGAATGRAMGGAGPMGDSRQGSRKVISEAEKHAKKLTLHYDGQSFTLYKLNA
ncbi:MAG: hypothetical protein J2O48_09865, partial [Solirubrobacterales bacterium]|nr:hypothetical protein [Solirubrobacterales bacterium]